MSQRASLLRTQISQWYQCSHLVKYSNGGCSGFEPDSLLHLLSKQLFKPYLLISYILFRYCSTFFLLLQYARAKNVLPNNNFCTRTKSAQPKPRRKPYTLFGYQAGNTAVCKQSSHGHEICLSPCPAMPLALLSLFSEIGHSELSRRLILALFADAD